MLNIPTRPKRQKVAVPVYYLPQTSGCTLKLQAVADEQTALTLAMEGEEVRRGYVCGTIQLPDKVAAGEYRYWLHCGTDTLGCGLARVGAYKRPATQYNEETKIIQYNG